MCGCSGVGAGCGVGSSWRACEQLPQVEPGATGGFPASRGLQDQGGLERPLGRVGGQSRDSCQVWGRQTLSERGPPKETIISHMVLR